MGKTLIKLSAVFILGTTAGIFIDKLYVKRHTKYAGDLLIDTSGQGEVSIAFNDHWSKLPEGYAIFKVTKKDMTPQGVA